MNILAGLKFQRRNPSAAPSAAAARVRTSVCPFMLADIVKKAAATAAMPAHSPSMWSRMLNEAVMPTTQRTVKQPSKMTAGIPGNKMGKKLRANSGSKQQQRGDRHADEELHLMMQQSAVIEEPDDCQKRGAGENSDDLLLRHAVQRKQNGQQRIPDRSRYRQAAESA